MDTVRLYEEEILATYPWLSVPNCGEWQWEGDARWQEADERTQEETEVSWADWRGTDYPRGKTQLQAPPTSPWDFQWEQDAGRPGLEVSSHRMSGSLELSNCMGSIDESQTDEEGFTAWDSSETGRETACSSVMAGDDYLCNSDGLIDETPGTGGATTVFTPGSKQGWDDALQPLEGLEMLSLSEDVEMEGCEPEGILMDEPTNWKWLETPAQRPFNQFPPQSPLKILPQDHSNWLSPGTPIPPPRTKEQEVEGIQFLLEISSDRPQLWENLVGMYFGEGRHPRAHLGYGKEAQEALRGEFWEWNWALQVIRETCPAIAPPSYSILSEQEGEYLQSIAASILDGNEDLFLAAIIKWQLERMAHDKSALENIMFRAGWCFNATSTPEWHLMAEIKNLPEGPHRAQLLQKAIQELPRFA
ncbi:hypothetical protein ACJ72_04901 [Emergomyces africanus]|uniref:Uncharacterized protein n=1 Tax=Emergomyces africanus TaxID=1955775 RepID=A0A1B7NVF8_9EURO|nr:hypothetical protein ACJ72_04901 [Emergomyces africanus]